MTDVRGSFVLYTGVVSYDIVDFAHIWKMKEV